MTDCREINELLGAHLDGELDAALSANVAAHVDACPCCSADLADLKQTAGLLRAHFEQLIDDAPPPPRMVREQSLTKNPAAMAKRKMRNIMMKTIAGIAAAALILAGLTLFPGRKLEATPRNLIVQASSNYLELADVELLVTPECRILGAPVDISLNGDGKEGTSNPVLPFKVLLQAPNRFLFHSDPLPGSFDPDGFMFGFDGKEAWSYDNHKKTVERCPVLLLGNRMKFRIDHGDKMRTTVTLKDTNSLDNLSWNYMRGLKEMSDALEITEITGPQDRRTGRRVFDLAARDDLEDEDSSIFWTRSRVTICPESDLIEKYEFDFSLFGIITFLLKVEVVRINQGLEPDFFGYKGFVPAGTEVVMMDVDPNDEEPAEEGTKSGATKEQ
jgi:hypothetical protein